MKIQDGTCIILLYILEQRSSWSTSRICPSWLCSGLKLSPILALPYEHGSCCHAQLNIWLFIATVQVSHTQHLLLSGWLLTNVQVNITTMLHDTWHTCIYITLVLLFISSFYTSSIFLGRLAAPNSHRLLQYLPTCMSLSTLWLLQYFEPSHGEQQVLQNYNKSRRATIGLRR